MNNKNTSGMDTTGRVQYPCMSIEAMTADEYGNQGKNLEIHFSFSEGPFGKMMVASTQKGLCSISLVYDETVAMDHLKKKFPKAVYKEVKEHSHQKALAFLTDNCHTPDPVKLHLKGTDFQVKVWRALLTIPFGKLVSYGDIARQINHPKAYRAVGSAVGDNPVFFLVPCHRVIQANGECGNYYWGTEVKKAIIGWESAKAGQV
ncbi:MAG: methylated-DNA--[protein]-cysteine S-methyltransferase [Bacteroidales bacterium]|nr:methylated-DNA--[protein]-cysteine S-methyltransferase [Bacteroidales bacterium]